MPPTPDAPDVVRSKGPQHGLRFGMTLKSVRPLLRATFIWSPIEDRDKGNLKEGILLRSVLCILLDHELAPGILASVEYPRSIHFN